MRLRTAFLIPLFVLIVSQNPFIALKLLRKLYSAVVINQSKNKFWDIAYRLVNMRNCIQTREHEAYNIIRKVA